MSSPFLERRFGKFSIDMDTIKQHHEAVADIMGCVVVLEATNSFVKDQVDYIACSAAFDIVEEGAMIPEYDMEYDGETGEVTWTVKEA